MPEFTNLYDWLIKENETLREKLNQSDTEVNRLRTYAFELTDPDCPSEYKRVIRQEITK